LDAPPYLDHGTAREAAIELAPSINKPNARLGLAVTNGSGAQAATPDIHILHIGNEISALPQRADSRHRISKRAVSGNVFSSILQAVKEVKEISSAGTAAHQDILHSSRQHAECMLRQAPCRFSCDACLGISDSENCIHETGRIRKHF
jgi:hypothetical protein